MTFMPDAETIYDAIGGEAAIRRIVEAFYPRVQADPVLSPLFPEDITPVMEKQFMFLSQFFGGPDLYTQAHGNPMMRRRHLPFPITPKHSAAWLGRMKEAMDEAGLEIGLRDLMLERLSGPAYFFVNTDDDGARI